MERRETAIEDELNAYADLDFDARVSAYVQDLQADLEDVINANPQSDEERHALFLRKRRYIDELLEKVVIDGRSSNLCQVSSGRSTSCARQQSSVSLPKSICFVNTAPPDFSSRGVRYDCL